MEAPLERRSKLELLTLDQVLSTNLLVKLLKSLLVDNGKWLCVFFLHKLQSLSKCHLYNRHSI